MRRLRMILTRRTRQNYRMVKRYPFQCLLVGNGEEVTVTTIPTPLPPWPIRDTTVLPFAILPGKKHPVQRPLSAPSFQPSRDMIVPERSHKLVQPLYAYAKTSLAIVCTTNVIIFTAFGQPECFAVFQFITLIRMSAPPLHSPGYSLTKVIADVVVIIVASTANRYLNCMMDVGFGRYGTFVCTRLSWIRGLEWKIYSAKHDIEDKGRKKARLISCPHEAGPLYP